MTEFSVQNNGKTEGGVTGNGFRPGRSGNPGGRPKGLARATRDLVGDDGVAVVEFWIATMNDPAAKMSDRLEASRLLADRGWGKPASFQLVEEDDPLGRDDAALEEAVAQFNREVRRLSGLTNGGSANGHIPDHAEEA